MGTSLEDDNTVYWQKLYDLRTRYEHDLVEMLCRVRKTNCKCLVDKDVEKKIQFIFKLLLRTPETQQFSCHIEILYAAEKQIEVWRALFMNSNSAHSSTPIIQYQ